MDVPMLLDKLDDLVYHSKRLRFRGQVRLDPNDVYALLDEIRVTLPEEIKHAEWIVRERQALQAERDGHGVPEGVGSVADLRRHAQRPVPPPLTPAAAEKVCSIIEAAEKHASELRALAEQDAERIRSDAARQASEFRSGGTTEASARLRRADDIARALLEEAGRASAELDTLLDRVRGPAIGLADALGDCATTLEAEVARMRAAGGELSVADAVPEPSSQPEPISERPEPVSQPTEEWSYEQMIEAEESGQDPIDASLPGPHSHVHAERLAGEEPVDDLDRFGPDLDLLERRPRRLAP